MFTSNVLNCSHSHHVRKAHVRLSDNTILSDPALQVSMHKTYADTFKLVGFTGGYWAYALNTNETSGMPTAAELGEWVPEGERRLGVYVLGWESIEVGILNVFPLGMQY